MLKENFMLKTKMERSSDEEQKHIIKKALFLHMDRKKEI